MTATPRPRAATALHATLAFGAGALHALSFTPLEAWWLQFAALAVLPWLILRAPRDSAVAGFAFGLGTFLIGVSWLYISMHRYGGMPAPLAALALLLFAAYLALFPALVALLTARGLRRAASVDGLAADARAASAAALLFGGLWGLAEMARGHLFTGFPWLAAGYAHVDGPLAGFAPWVGVYGISALAALAAAGLALLVRLATVRAGLACALLPIAAGAGLAQIDWVEPAGRPLTVRLLQGNVPQEMKFDRERSLRAMLNYTEQVLQAPAALTVLPETAWTVPWGATPPQLVDALAAYAARHDARIAIGMPLAAPPAAMPPDAAPRGGSGANAGANTGPGASPPAPLQRRITNSVAVIDGSGAVTTRYDKRHLVPFGEFIPTGFGWFVRLMDIPLGEFARGAARQAPLTVGDARVGFNICYEDLFGEELARQVHDGATVMVNVSNIAWFGDSHALPQHLQIARMRSIEFARPMLRSTNTGVTAGIDAHGRVVAQLPPYTVGALTLEIAGAKGVTPFARAATLLPLALSLALLGAGALAARAGRRADRRAGREGPPALDS
ncbi:MAG: apolipoprotein N-acyltransferase [Burkholderiaceae bacterium]